MDRRLNRWDGICRVRRKHIVCFGINHLIRITVVCRDADNTAAAQNCVYNLAHAFINCFNGLNGAVKNARVTNHVTVCKVKNYNIIFTAFNS